MEIAIYPGTFDPPTLGHIDIIQRASPFFYKLIIAVGGNINKNKMFSLEERVELMKTATKKFPKIEVIPFKGLLVDFAAANQARIIIRSIRTIFDFEFETMQGQINSQLGDVETFYLAVNEKYRLVSSSLVRELAAHGKKLSRYIPSEIEETVSKKLSNQKTKCC